MSQEEIAEELGTLNYPDGRAVHRYDAPEESAPRLTRPRTRPRVPGSRY